MYEIIYADPPWRYDFSINTADSIEAHYPTMTTQEICDMDTPTAKNAALFLWTTAPKLREAFTVMDAWGFTYKTNLVWDKEWIGMGYWSRGQHELLLIGTKGTFSPPKPQQRIPSIIRERRTEHSKKPNKIRTLIKEWYPDKRKIELFARQTWTGWDAHGDEAHQIKQSTLNPQYITLSVVTP